MFLKKLLILSLLLVSQSFAQTEKKLLNESFENGLNGWYSYDNSGAGAKWKEVPNNIEGVNDNLTSFVVPNRGDYSAYCAGYGYELHDYYLTITAPQYRNNMDTELIIPSSKLDALSSANSARMVFQYNIPSIDGGAYTNNQDYFAVYAIDKFGNHNEIWRTDETTTDWEEMPLDLTPYLSNIAEIAFFFHSDGSHTEQGVYIDDVEILYKEKPFIHITSPSSYDQWVKGNTHKVEWNSNFDDDVSVELWKSGSNSPIISHPSNPNTGEFTFPVPSYIEKGEYYIRIQSEGSSYATDNSDVFSIVDKVDAICISTFNLDFGYVQKDKKLVRFLTVTNCGNTSASYSISRAGSSRFYSDVNSFNLDVNESKEVQITFAPTSTGSYEATFTVNSPSGSVNVSCEGYGVDYSSNIGILQANNTDYAEVIIGRRKDNDFRIKNYGSVYENVTLSIEGTSEFSVKNDEDKSFSLSPGSAKVIEIRFRPSSRGDKVANLVARASSDGSEFKYSLTGSGIELADVPTILPVGGTYYESQSISMNSSSEFEIRYTADGSEPNSQSKLYSGPFDLNRSGAIKAKSFWKNTPPYTRYSSIVSNSYQITGTLNALVPNLVAQTYYGDIVLKFLNIHAGSNIYYTLDGSEPSENSTLYLQENGILLSETKIVKARAFKENWQPSPVFTGQYEIVKILEKPFFAPSSDSTYKDSVSVFIFSSNQGSVIKYSVDGSTPNSNSLTYASSITLYETTTIKAKVYKEGWSESEVATAIYAINQQLSAPNLSTPFNKSMINDSSPTFGWTTISAATGYDIQVGDDSTFISPLIDISVHENEYKTTEVLPNNKYFWRVRSKNTTEISSWSAIWSFTINLDYIEDLVAYYPFNGNANDESGSGNNGTVVGPILTADRFGNLNSAYYFDGVDNYIDCGIASNVDPLLNSFSISAWVKMAFKNDDSRNTLTIVGKQDGSEDYSGFSLYFNQADNIVVFSINDEGDWQNHNEVTDNNSIKIEKEEWHHIVSIADQINKKLILYVDGIKTSESPITVTNNIRASKGHLLLGGYFFGSAFLDGFKGSLDDVSIYNRVLSENEIEDLYGEYSQYPKVYILKRMVNNNNIEFNFEKDKWSFANTRLQMWPEESWINNDYSSHPFLNWDKRYRARKSDFPSWELFVEAYGEKQSYFKSESDAIFKPSALLYWRILKEINYDRNRKLGWRGSCGGFAISAGMVFQDKQSFRETFDTPEFSYLGELPDAKNNNQIQRTINTLWARQFGFHDLINVFLNRKKTAKVLLEEIKEMLTDTTEPLKFLLILGEKNIFQAHSVNPYKIEEYEDYAKVYIYDNNYPYDNNRYVVIDKINDRWYYEQNPSYSGRRNIYLSRDINSYYNYPKLPTSFLSILGKKNVQLENDNYTTIFFNENSIIKIIDPLGNSISNYDSLVNQNLEFGIPIIPTTDSLSNTMGFFVKKDQYNIEFESSDTTSFFTVFNDSTIYDFESNENNNIKLLIDDNLISYDNQGTKSTKGKLMAIKSFSSHEKIFELQDYSINNNEKVNLELIEESSISITNYGNTKTYNLVIQNVSNEGSEEFRSDSVLIAENSNQKVVLDSLSSRIKILNDFDNDGVFDDSLFVTSIGLNNSLKLKNIFKLTQNYPNPFNPSSKISYSIPEQSQVILKIFDVLGNEVKTLVNKNQGSGNYEVEFDGSKLSSGIYFYRLQAGDFIETKKMILLK